MNGVDEPIARTPDQLNPTSAQGSTPTMEVLLPAEPKPESDECQEKSAMAWFSAKLSFAGLIGKMNLMFGYARK